MIIRRSAPTLRDTVTGMDIIGALMCKPITIGHKSNDRRHNSHKSSDNTKHCRGRTLHITTKAPTFSNSPSSSQLLLTSAAVPTDAILPPRKDGTAVGISSSLAASTAKMAVAAQEKVAMVPATLALGPLATREVNTTTTMPAVLPSTGPASEAMTSPALAILASSRQEVLLRIAPDHVLPPPTGPTTLGQSLLLLRRTVEGAARAAPQPLATAKGQQLDIAAHIRALQAGAASTDFV